MPSPPLLNVDAGELADEPEALYATADLVHVACGGHAGDEGSMERVVRACARDGTRVGAHPSYVDREGFGRARLDVPPAELLAQLVAQHARLRAVADGLGVRLFSSKPHGALYHAANTDPALAEACVQAALRVLGRPAIVGPPAGALREAALSAGLPYLREAFADRGVREDGSLVPRGEPGALVDDPAVAAARARALASRDDVDTICLHGDTKNALAIAAAVRRALGPRP